MKKEIGKVKHYYSKIGVAVVDVEDPLFYGDHVLIAGHGHTLKQDIDSMERDHHQIITAYPGDSIGIKVQAPVREGDIILRDM